MRHASENIGILRNTHTNKTTSVWNRHNHTVPSFMMNFDESRPPPHAPLRLSPLPPPQQSYRAIQEAGSPVNPLEFPTPVIYRAYLRTQQSVRDHHRHTPNQYHQPQPTPQRSSFRSNQSLSGPAPAPSPPIIQNNNATLLCHVHRSDYAYWIKHAIPSIGPNIHWCVMVVRRGPDDDDHPHAAHDEYHHRHRSNDHVDHNDWVTTEKWVSMKSTSLHQSRPRTPTTEAACLQLIGNYHGNILGCIEVLQSDDYVYTVMPYYPGSCTLDSYHLQQQQQQQRPPLASAPQWNTIRPPTYTSGNNANTTMIRERNDPKRIDQMSVDVPPSDNTITTVSSDGTILTSDDNTSIGGTSSAMFTVYENNDQKIYNRNNHCTRKAITPHENHVRMLFLQLLEALQHLQRKGVCHRNITPSTVLIVEINPVSASCSNGSCCGSHLVVLTDFSNAVRVPYQDDSNVGGIADVSQGSSRFLIKNTDYHRARTAKSPSHDTNRTVVTTNRTSPRVRRYQSASLSPTNRHNQPTSRKSASTLPMPNRKTLKSSLPQRRQQRSPFVAPELIEGQPYDGYTVDLWSVGVLLYVMLIGAIPFHVPNMTTDVQYRQISLGQLKKMIRQQRTLNNVSQHQQQQQQQQQDYVISDEVIDLLQNMFWYDPHKRLTLQDVMVHPWVRSNYTLLQQQQF